jgi:hypothetical protein
MNLMTFIVTRIKNLQSSTHNVTMDHIGLVPTHFSYLHIFNLKFDNPVLYDTCHTIFPTLLISYLPFSSQGDTFCQVWVDLLTPTSNVFLATHATK